MDATEENALLQCPIRPELVKLIIESIRCGKTRILLAGPSGSGKTRLARAILSSISRSYVEVNSLYAYGPIERESLRILSDKMHNSVLLESLEDFSMKATPRDVRLTFALSSLLKAPTLLIATSRDASSVDPSLSSQFQATFSLKPPTIGGRKSLFEAASPTFPVVAQYLATPAESRHAFLEQFSGLQPSELLLSKPLEMSPPLSQVAGYSRVLSQLELLVLKAVTEPEIFTNIGVLPPRGILLTGPPGCGKTLIARSLGQASRVSFFDVKSVDIISKEVGGSEMRLHSVFERARASAPSIILFDDIDSIAVRRSFGALGSDASDRLLTTLLVETDGISGRDDGVVIIGTTSRPMSLDPAITRPGRFDFIIEIPLPNEEDRGLIFDLYAKGVPVEDRESVRKAVIDSTVGLSGADIAGVIQEAAMITLRISLDAKSIPIASFEQAISSLKVKRPTKPTTEKSVFEPSKKKRHLM